MIALRRQGPNPPGFTLMEVLLAVGIFSIVLLAIHLVFYGAVRLRNKTTTEIESALPLQQTLTLLRRDLSNLVLPGGILSGELQSTPTTGTQLGQTGSAPLATQAGDLPGQSSPDFYTTTAALDDVYPWPEIQRVSYFLANPTNQTVGRDLFRSVTRNLLPVLEEPPDEQWMMSGVQSILFYYYDGQVWRDTWDSATETNALPGAIKVAIQLASAEGIPTTGPSAPAPIELVVPILVRAGTNQTQQTGGG
jgi:prepilin-type N-terminal cleavage/methylation domain-containing protein